MLDENIKMLSEEEKQWLGEFFLHRKLPSRKEVNKKSKHCIVNENKPALYKVKSEIKEYVKGTHKLTNPNLKISNANMKLGKKFFENY